MAHASNMSPSTDLNNKNVGRSCSPPSKIIGLQQFHASSSSPNGKSQTKESNTSQASGSTKVMSPLKKIANTASARKHKMMSNLIKRPPVEIEYDNLTYSVTERHSRRWIGQCRSYKTILKGISGKFKPGELMLEP